MRRHWMMVRRQNITMMMTKVNVNYYDKGVCVNYVVDDDWF